MFTFVWWMPVLDVVCVHVCALIRPVFHFAATSSWERTNHWRSASRVNTVMWSLIRLSICARYTYYLSIIHQPLHRVQSEQSGSDCSDWCLDFMQLSRQDKTTTHSLLALTVLGCNVSLIIKHWLNPNTRHSASVMSEMFCLHFGN